MAHDGPELIEILRTVREFVDDITPRLDGLDRYHALCARFLLEVAGRELATWAPRETGGDARLRALVGAPPERPMGEVLAELCAAIRAGRFDDDLDTLRETLMDHVIEKVRVSKPEALAPEHRPASEENDE